MMDFERFGHICECLLFASGEPVQRDALRLAFTDELEPERFEDLFEQFIIEYNRSHRGLQIIEVASGYQLASRPEHAAYIRKIRTIRCKSRLSRAACETLAIVAYRQPVTAPEIEQIRGVDVAGPLKSLIEKDLITILGRKRGPGNPMLYGTTSRFLIQFGLKDLKSLPDIHEFEEVLSRTESPELPFSTTSTLEMIETPTEDHHLTDHSDQ